MRYALFILLMVSCYAHAETNKFILKTSIKNGLKEIEVDLNQDGKRDRVERYRGETLVSMERDSKFSGKIDEWTTFFQYESAKKPIEVTKKDSNGDGKIDRIETLYKDPAHDLFILSTEVDSTFSGKFDKKFTTHSKISQKKDQLNCLSDKNFEDLKILKLTEDVDKVKMSLDGGFYKTDWGYKIHQSCLDKWGGDVFPSLLKASMNKGFQCLAKLAKDNEEKNPELPNGALNNFSGLEYLLQTSGVSIVCNEKNYDWNGTEAHASTRSSDVIKESGVKHPFISVNEKQPKTTTKPTQEETDELSMTLFHEQLHNLGIRHGESLEFPYACETCCIANVQGEEKENACKVCSGVYTGTSDKNYLNDLLAWGKTSYQEERAAKAILKYQKEFPKDRWAMFAYADSSTGIFSPVGIEMANILKAKFKNLTDEEKIHLKNIEYYESLDNLKDPVTSRFSKMVAEAHVANYFDGDSKTTLNNLEKNKATIKDLLKRESEATENKKYILESIKKKLDDLLVDIWLNDHPNKNSPESDRAYNLLLDTGMLK